MDQLRIEVILWVIAVMYVIMYMSVLFTAIFDRPNVVAVLALLVTSSMGSAAITFLVTYWQWNWAIFWILTTTHAGLVAAMSKPATMSQLTTFELLDKDDIEGHIVLAAATIAQSSVLFFVCDLFRLI